MGGPANFSSTDPNATGGSSPAIVRTPASHGAAPTNATLTAGGRIYQFDAIGRVVSVVDATNGNLALTYGPNGQILVAVRSAAGASTGGTYSYIYDENGQRLMKLNGSVIPAAGSGQTTPSLVAASTVVAAYIGDTYLDNNLLVQPVRIGSTLVGVINNGVFQPVATDSNGTIIGDTTNLSAGTAVQSSTADIQTTPSPYGARATYPQIAAAFDYIGQHYDPDLGFERMGVRDYDPRIAQFTTPDPLYLSRPTQLIGDTASTNLYSYAGNDPVNFSDPTGMHRAAPLHVAGPASGGDDLGGGTGGDLGSSDDSDVGSSSTDGNPYGSPANTTPPPTQQPSGTSTNTEATQPAAAPAPDSSTTAPGQSAQAQTTDPGQQSSPEANSDGTTDNSSQDNSQSAAQQGSPAASAGNPACANGFTAVLSAPMLDVASSLSGGATAIAELGAEVLGTAAAALATIGTAIAVGGILLTSSTLDDDTMPALSISTADNSSADTSDAPPIPGAVPAGPTSGGTPQYTKPGGAEQANQDFDELGLSNVEDRGGGVRTGQMPDGSYVTVYPDSSGGGGLHGEGPPTISISGTKVRYGP